MDFFLFPINQNFFSYFFFYITVLILSFNHQFFFSFLIVRCLISIRSISIFIYFHICNILTLSSFLNTSQICYSFHLNIITNCLIRERERERERERGSSSILISCPRRITEYWREIDLLLEILSIFRQNCNTAV